MDKKDRIRLLLVTPEKDRFSDFSSALEGCEEISLDWSESGESALKKAKDSEFSLIVTDETLGDMTGIQLADKLLRVNPMIHCAAVSSLSPEEFHEASEGLGILAQLSPRPDRGEADSLLAHYHTINAL